MPEEESVLVTHIAPSALGLRWGASKEQCLTIRAISPRKQTAEDAAAWAEIDRTVQAMSGLTWDEVLEGYQEMITRFPALSVDLSRSFEVDLTLHGAVYQATLYFDEQERLDEIKVLLRESECFWDSDDELLPARWEEYRAYYEALVGLHRRMLGAPDFSGDYTEKEYPEAVGYYDALTHWDRPEGRFLIALGQEDRETPVFVIMACCRI